MMGKLNQVHDGKAKPSIYQFVLETTIAQAALAVCTGIAAIRCTDTALSFELRV